MKVLIVGYGNMGRNHKRVLQQLGHEVVTVDPDPAAGADLLESSVFKSVRGCRLDAEGFDAACISAPIRNLAALASSALKDCPVLVEKPGATSLDHLRVLKEISASFAHHLAVGYTERFNPALPTLRENLHLVGVVRHISVRRLGYARDRAGDPALDLATHDLDVLDALGFGLPTVDHVARCGAHLSALLHEGDTTISLEASHLHPEKIRTLEVVGDDGVLVLDYQAQSVRVCDERLLWTEFAVDKAEPLAREWEAFFNGQGSTGLAALAVAEQLAEEVTDADRHPVR